MRLVPGLGLLLAALCAAGPAQAQHRLPAAGVWFDDFAYRTTHPPLDGVRDRPLAENALFGVNTWCLDLACRRSVAARAWYWYNWFEPYFQRVDPLTTLTATPEGTLDFTLRAGRHAVAGTAQRQVASGFTARTGVWAAAVTFSDLPNGLPAHMVAPGTPERVSMMQSFWLIAPGDAIRTPSPGTPTRAQRHTSTEYDFEFNNWFFDSAAPRAMATGYAEDGEDPDGDGYAANTMRLRPPGQPAAPPHTCRIERAGRAPVVGTPERCSAILAGVDPEAGPDVPTVMLVRASGSRVQFELQATWPRGALRMETPPFAGAVQPSQPVMTMLSLYLAAPVDSAFVSVPREQRMRTDWTYHSPDAARALADVVADVAAIRQQRRTRLYTIPDADPAGSIARPYRLRQPGDREPSYEPIVALQPLRIEAVVAPATTADEVTALVILGRRAGNVLVEWRETAIDATGRAGTPTPYQNTSGLRTRTRLPRGAVCLRLDVRATRQEYHDGPDGVWWTSLDATGRDRAEASHVACRRGARRPPGL